MSREDLKLMMKIVFNDMFQKRSKKPATFIPMQPNNLKDVSLDVDKKRLIDLIPSLPPRTIGVLLMLTELSLSSKMKETLNSSDKPKKTRKTKRSKQD